MDQVHVIRHKVLLEGKSVRSVAKEMGVSRNTVAKYLKNPEPRRTVARKQKPAPVMEMVAPRIEEILSEWRERTTAKQRITGTRVHRQLVEEGYEVGITTVRDYLREQSRFRNSSRPFGLDSRLLRHLKTSLLEPLGQGLRLLATPASHNLCRRRCPA